MSPQILDTKKKKNSNTSYKADVYKREKSGKPVASNKSSTTIKQPSANSENKDSKTLSVEAATLADQVGPIHRHQLDEGSASIHLYQLSSWDDDIHSYFIYIIFDTVYLSYLRYFSWWFLTTLIYVIGQRQIGYLVVGINI